jgi:hypothetical protein
MTKVGRLERSSMWICFIIWSMALGISRTQTWQTWITGLIIRRINSRAKVTTGRMGPHDRKQNLPRAHIHAIAPSSVPRPKHSHSISIAYLDHLCCFLSRCTTSVYRWWRKERVKGEEVLTDSYVDYSVRGKFVKFGNNRTSSRTSFLKKWINSRPKI